MNPQVKFKIKNFGEITAELYPDVAPDSVNNFLSLASDGFYDGLTFHRVIKGFMIQGGCPQGSGMGDPGYSIKGEFSGNGFDNNLKHTAGVLSMARSQHPNSAGSQFFLMHKDSPHLDGSYAAFGKVIENQDVVNKIAETKTGFGDKPKDDVVIESVEVILNDYEIGEFKKY
ncbi:peptidylprolyl isomerase [Desulfuribacillus alkaliarsenatis]|uniref:Peptidyl-prolyl cis-trans isomerase n=1 Tax=Desulfuribacillus alkaliarsenatis TaxID=766136 RepID=A0A1E5G4N8_9FIRM|nr:peptidylprolyl isomerase [Desulfuribacillus alkaliarsenatis]OEF97980.1 peptidylprolyl isomerase [Desulfuribacillus alkaliarsenatis]